MIDKGAYITLIKQPLFLCDDCWNPLRLKVDWSNFIIPELRKFSYKKFKKNLSALAPNEELEIEQLEDNLIKEYQSTDWYKEFHQNALIYFKKLLLEEIIDIFFIRFIKRLKRRGILPFDNFDEL